MIQPYATAPQHPKLRRNHIGPSMVLVWLSLLACQTPGPKPSPQSPASKEPRSFVPPFAYEAYIRGELALAAGKPSEAAVQLEMATAAPDEDAYLLSRLADAQAANGERALAQQTLAEAERVGPCTENVWLTRGAWAERAKQLEQAARAYRTALSCAPGSDASALALYRVLRAQGRTAESLALLHDPLVRLGDEHEEARQRSAGGLRVALSHALAQGSVAEAGFALESWAQARPVDSEILKEAAAQAVTRRQEALALRLAEFSLERLPPATRAELAELMDDRETLRALLAQHPESALGGAWAAARYALMARDFERAELYVSFANGEVSDERLRAIKIAALQGLGDDEAALADLRALEDGETRRTLARAALARLGLEALAEELAARAP